MVEEIAEDVKSVDCFIVVYQVSPDGNTKKNWLQGAIIIPYRLKGAIIVYYISYITRHCTYLMG